MSKTVKLEGFVGLYKGFSPTWMRIGPWAMVGELSPSLYMVVLLTISSSRIGNVYLL